MRLSPSRRRVGPRWHASSQVTAPAAVSSVTAATPASFTLAPGPSRAGSDAGPRTRTDPDPDAALVALLRSGDEDAYAQLVSAYTRSMLLVAGRYARSHAIAEEAVQETWLAVWQGVGRFEGRSSFKTWVFRILVNQAQSRAARESRVLPLTDVLSRVRDQVEAADGLASASRERWPGHWSAPSRGWAEEPDQTALAGELANRLEQAIAALPHRQREVLTLRDVDGYSASDVCRMLGIQPTNQRVLLHRARTAVRAGMGSYLAL